MFGLRLHVQSGKKPLKLRHVITPRNRGVCPLLKLPERQVRSLRVLRCLVGVPRAMASKRVKVDNLLAGCKSLSANRSTILRLEADFVTCTQ